MPSSVLINIFISTEDGITEKLLLFKIKFVYLDMVNLSTYLTYSRLNFTSKNDILLFCSVYREWEF